MGFANCFRQKEGSRGKFDRILQVMAIVVTLDRVMRRKGVRARDLAPKVGITEVNLSRVKTGKIRAIRFSTLDALCRELDASPGDLIDYVPDDEVDPGIHVVCWPSNEES